MRFITTLNNQKCMEWGINATQGILVALLYEANAWANEEIIDDKIYYFVSRNLILKELPMFFEKADTVYRNLKVLAEKGIIEYIKHKFTKSIEKVFVEETFFRIFREIRLKKFSSVRE